MSNDYSFTIDGHPVIYNGYARKLNIYFSEPDIGVNDETGIVLLIPGYGGNSHSNVYKKMRSVFSDTHNMVVVQCDYFGWEFMQSDLKKETPFNFNDMGLMQALDNITAVISVMEIIKDNRLSFNNGKIIIYGHSHGAYLAYLCNAFAPSLFSLIIDNSAWIFPLYLLVNRELFFSSGEKINFNYLATSIVPDPTILHLPTLYNKIENQCVINSYHGSGDTMITIQQKRDFCSHIEKCKLHEITSDKVDNRVFRDNSHGLNADYLLMFDYVMSQVNVNFQHREELVIGNQRIETSGFEYFFDYSNQLPLLRISPKE